jgi:hypothetical protein
LCAAGNFSGGIFMGLEDRVWYREMLDKEEEKKKASNEIKLSEKVSNKYNIWHLVIVITLIVWVTIFIFYYMIPMVFVHSIMNEATSLVNEALKPLSVVTAPNISQVNKVNNQLMEMTLPENGKYNMFYAQNRAVATFKVIAEPYNNYYVCLLDHFDNPVLNIFVRAGDVAKVRVPLGVYEFKWTRGEKWYGDKNLFGSEIVFKKAIETLRFSEEETKSGKKIIGNTINFNEIRSNTPLIQTSVNEF